MHDAARRSGPRGILTRLRRVRHYRRTGGEPIRAEDEYGFLLGQLIDAATLQRAHIIAQSWRVPPHEVLIALGWIGEGDYVEALARHLRLPVAASAHVRPLHRLATYPVWPKVVSAKTAAGEMVLVEARGFAPGALRSIAASTEARNGLFALATRQQIARLTERQVAPVLVDRATNALWRQADHLSARTPHKLWQLLLVACVLGLAIGMFLVAPEVAAPGLAAILAVPFLCIVALRAAAVVEILRPAVGVMPPPDTGPGQQDWALPVYSVLVPLLREVEVLPRLVRALAAIDYPAAKLQILLVLEGDDGPTRAAAAALDLPGNFEIVVVPDRGPRTKPKALNYALEMVKGEFVAVYDAEDMPEPDQLRRALAMFEAAGPTLACVQARLNVYNPHESWLTRGIMAQTPLAFGFGGVCLALTA